MPKAGILERLKKGPVLGDGGYLLELEKRGWVRPGPFTPEVAVVYPDALRELHIEFREAGAEVSASPGRLPKLLADADRGPRAAGAAFFRVSLFLLVFRPDAQPREAGCHAIR